MPIKCLLRVESKTSQKTIELIICDNNYNDLLNTLRILRFETVWFHKNVEYQWQRLFFPKFSFNKVIYNEVASVLH